MRWCYNNREDVKEKGILSSKQVSALTESNMIDSIVNIITTTENTNNQINYINVMDTFSEIINNTSPLSLIQNNYGNYITNVK